MALPRALGGPSQRPASFNEAYAKELSKLRPHVFKDVEGAPLETGAYDNYDRRADDDHDRHDKEKARAENLAELFRQVGTDLKEGDASRWDEKTAPLAALCLSGGGIRSATFNLGMLQGLARKGLLKQFDYLSSVSGGGFVAGWLKAWMHRDGSESVIEQLSCAATCVDPLHPEPKPLDQLRHYSNYLTPRVGLFSPDTWTVVALVLRNLLLNWLVIVPVLAAIVTIPQMGLIVAGDGTIAAIPKPWLYQAGSVIATLAVALGFLASYNVHRFRRISLQGRRGSIPGVTPHRRIPERTVATWAVAPLCLAALLLAIAALARPRDTWCCGPGSAFRPTLLFAMVWAIGIPLAGWAFNRPSHRAWRELAALLISGAIGGAILVALAKWGVDYLSAQPRLYVVVALPLLLADYLLARALFVGFAGDRGTSRVRKHKHETWLGATVARATLDRADHDREWWGRFSGWVMAIAVTWALLSVIGVLAFDVLHRYLPGILAAVGGASGIAAAILGKSGDTASGRDGSSKSVSRAKQWGLLLAAPTFVVLLLILLAQGNVVLAGAIKTGLRPRPEIQLLVLPGLLVMYVAVAAIVGAFVNVNRFSLHGLYRNRLVRAYLGASNKQRHEDPFTGFAQGDNIFLHELWRPSGSKDRPVQATRPLPVINASLNLVTGEHLAWQQRKAESFSMTPFYCGNFHEGYRPSTEYGGEFGISLGTAMTISGAAANPNMGYHSSAAVTFLMALFNARLGSWLGNTNDHGALTYRLPGPKWAVKPLFAELLGMTTSTSRYVNLSDGGHFDNLGLYEMVLRRCRYILVSDAGRDPGHSFEDLGNAIRKVRIDFGIPITFEKKIEIRPRRTTEDLSRAEKSPNLFCALAKIRYSEIDGSPEDADGWLVYVKPALDAKGSRKAVDAPVPYDVFSYARRSQDFPHETTTDQWFDEAQFESYRALGMHIISQLTDAMGKDRTPSFPEFRQSVRDYMGESAAAAKADAAAPTEKAAAAGVAAGTAPAERARSQREQSVEVVTTPE
ncbi:MAG: patatin-like phospholipase family protein [Gemmatimonadota bacterium]|nr:patatin-like phospholipase family protein [Gemmatimonadota bacterium]